MFFLSLLLCVIFMILGGFHIYWVLGGTFGVDKVIPTKDSTANSIPVPPIATWFVALVLMSFGILYLAKSGLMTMPLPDWMTTIAYWFIPSIFLLRAIGEFNYVGFFKKIQDTAFAKADSLLFSPLCLLIGAMGLLVQVLG